MLVVSVAQDRKTARHLSKIIAGKEDVIQLAHVRKIVGKILRSNGLPETSKVVIEVLDKFTPEDI